MGNGLTFVVRPNSQIRLAESSIAADFPIISPAGRLAGLEAVIQKVAADTLRHEGKAGGKIAQPQLAGCAIRCMRRKSRMLGEKPSDHDSFRSSWGV
jgi:hypothetical protein